MSSIDAGVMSILMIDRRVKKKVLSVSFTPQVSGFYKR
jgi:hypothetical protein